MSIGRSLGVQRDFQSPGGQTLPTSPPTEEIGALTQWAPGLPGWYTYAGDDLERSPQLMWPNSILTYSQMRHDAQAQGLYLGTTLPLRRYHWILDPNGCDPKQVSNLARDLSLDVKGSEPLPKRKYRNRFNFTKHLQDALLSLIFGHYAFEQVGEIGDDGLWHLTKLAPRPPETISEIFIDSVGDLVGYKQFFSSTPAKAPGMIIAEHSTWYAWMMEGANWTGRSMLRACYRNWLRKDRLLRVDAQKQERNGMGIPIAEAPPGMSGAGLIRLDSLMRRLRAGDMSGGAVPAGTKVTLTGTTGTLPDTLASIRLDNEEMARAWLAMFMQLGQTETGSRALGSEFIDFFSDAIDEMAYWFCGTFTGSVIENWWDWNVGEDEDATPQLMFTRNPDSAFSGRDFAWLVERGAITLDEELENAIRDRYGLPNRMPGMPKPALPAPPGSEPWPPGEAPTPPLAPQAPQDQSSEAQAARAPEDRRRGRPVQAQATGSPVSLPDRPLRRQPYQHEIQAAVDWQAIDTSWQQARNQLVTQVHSAQLRQIDQLHDQIVEAGNDLTSLGDIQADPEMEAMLFTAMSNMAVQGAHDAQNEASRQGTTVQLPDLTTLSNSQRIRAQVIDKFLANSISAAARANALRLAGGTLSGGEIASKVKDKLLSLSTAYLQDQLGGAMTASMNSGRRALMAEGQPSQIYASELLDDNTCTNCIAEDGTQFVSLDDAERFYPSGGFVECLGGSRCRGTLVAVYGETTATIQ